MHIKRCCKKTSSLNQDLLYLSAWPIQKRDSISVHDDKKHEIFKNNNSYLCISCNELSVI